MIGWALNFLPDGLQETVHGTVINPRRSTLNPELDSLRGERRDESSISRPQSENRLWRLHTYIEGMADAQLGQARQDAGEESK